MGMVAALSLLFISSVFGAFSTLFFKMSSKGKISPFNKQLVGAVTLAGISFLFYMYALKQAPLTFLYLIASVNYIWAVLLARFVLKETIGKSKIAGVCLIILGIIIMQV